VTQVNGSCGEEVKTKWTTMAALVLVAAATLVGAGVANAEDFNITVPIRVSSWPREVA
jgi:hypothetical protein